jgi:ankyrin repeat protein
MDPIGSIKIWTTDKMDLIERVQSGDDDLLSQVPLELLLDITLRFMKPPDILRLCQVSSVFNERLCQNDYFWKQLYQRDISTQQLPTAGMYRSAYQTLQRYIQQHTMNDNRVYAATHGYEKLFDTLIRSDPLHKDYFVPLTKAAQNGHLDIVRRILALTSPDSFWPALTQGAAHGQRQIVDYILHYVAAIPIDLDDVLNEALISATSGGHRDLVNELIHRGANDYNGALLEAAGEGYADIVTDMVSRGANDYNEALLRAAYSGHQDIVDYIISRGANAFNEAMELAAINGHQDIINDMLQHGATSYNETMVEAARNGFPAIVNQMIDLGANDYNRAMANAAYYGHSEIVNRMLELGANNYNWALASAASSGYPAIVDQMIKRGANDYNTALNGAAGGGHLDIVQHLIDLGANNYDEAIDVAAMSYHPEVVDLLERYRNPHPS